MTVEIVGHEPRMFHGDAEAQALHIVDIRHVFQQGRYDQISTAVRHRTAQGVQIGELCPIISAVRPFQGIQIDRIRHTEILEGGQQFAVDGLRQPDLRSYTVVEVGQDALSVHALRRGGQAKQDLRLIIGQQLLIGGCRRMMEFVHDDIVIEVRRRFLRKGLRVEGLDGHEQMVDALRPIAADEHGAKVRILQYGAEGDQALLQDLLPVGNEQQPAGFAGILLTEPFVVQCGDNGLPRAGGGHHQIAPVVPHCPLGVQLIQYLLLIGVGLNLNGIELQIVGIVILLRLQRPGEAFLLPFVIVFKLV